RKVADQERARLLQLEQPHDLVAGRGLEVHLNDDLVQVLGERSGAPGAVEVHLGVALGGDERAVRRLERAVLDVYGLRVHHRRVLVGGRRRGLGVLLGHGVSSFVEMSSSSLPALSRAYRSSKPPTW